MRNISITILVALLIALCPKVHAQNTNMNDTGKLTKEKVTELYKELQNL